MTRKFLPTAAAMAVSLLLAATASATQIFDPSLSRCSERNCSAVELGGTVNGFLSSAVPWVIQVFAGAKQCLRVEVTSQEVDLEMRLVSPDGSVTWFNDDSAERPCLLCPVVAVRAPQEGWYTVHIGEFGGAAVQANFTLAYGLYNRANPNCATPTPPGTAPASTLPKGGVSPAPQFAPGR